MEKRRWALAAGAFILLIGLTPLAAQAQAGMDPEVRETAHVAAVEVGRVARPATIAGGARVLSGLPNLLPTPAPDPTATPAPERPSFDVTDAVAYESEGLTLFVPSGWDVERAIEFGTLFDITIPDTDIAMSVQDAGEEAPGVATLVMFRDLGEELPASFGLDATLELADTVLTDQGLPLTRIQYHGNNTTEDVGGAFYIFSSGTKLYLLIASSPIDVWPEFRDVVDWMARGLVVDEEQIDLVTAEGADFYFVDEDGEVEVWVPDGWRVSDMYAAGAPVVMADADYRYALMLTSDAQLDGGNELLQLTVMLTAGAYENAVDGLARIVMDAAISDYEDLQLDADTLVSYPHDGGVTVGVTGELALEQDAVVPVTVYLDLSDGRLAAAIAVGDMDALLGEQETVLKVVQSLASLE